MGESLIRYDDVLARIGALEPIRRVERVPLSEAQGRVLARDLVAREVLPPFDNSAMDGFALRSADTAAATAARPARLSVGETVFAGAPLPEAATSGVGAVRIMTGAPLPSGYDTVVRVEDAVVEAGADGERLVCAVPVAAGQNVRRRGEDTPLGRTLLVAPCVLGAGRIAVAAGQGVGEIDVVARPRIRLVATGDELVVDPAQPLRPGQIRNTSLPFLSVECDRLALPALREAVMSDDESDAAARIGAWIDALRGRRLDDPDDPAVPDVVISTGAVSMGERDFLPALLPRLGFEVFAHRVAVRPGRPVLLARHAEVPLIWAGLPGNVLSTAAGLRFFARPVLRRLVGLEPRPPALRARITRPFPKPDGLRFFARCSLRAAADGTLEAELERRQASGILSALCDTDAYAVMPEAGDLVEAGTAVDVFPDADGL